MHPLNTALEDLPHEQQIPKRRSSLDNSLLAPGRSSRLLTEADDEDEKESNQPRRLSLNNHARITISFLASGHLKRTHGDLDMDYHKSEHAPGDAKKLSSTGTTAEDVSDDDDDSTLSYDDCDSFCDASVQQEADKDYLRRDLGASCIWDDTTTVDTGLVEELEEMSLDSVPEDLCEVDEEDEEADEEKKNPPVAESDANTSEPGTVAVLKRAKRRSFTKRIPRILFRSKSPKPKVIIRKKSATQEQVEQV